MLKAEPAPVLIDVLGGRDDHRSLPGAYWLPGGDHADSCELILQTRHL